MMSQCGFTLLMLLMGAPLLGCAFSCPAVTFSSPRLRFTQLVQCALEDRPEEVAKIRSAARGVLRGLLQNVLDPDQAAARRPGGRSEDTRVVKSAAPLSGDAQQTVVGFIGVGAITRHVVTGLCRYSTDDLAIVLRCANA